MEGLRSAASSRELLFSVAVLVLFLLGVVRRDRFVHRFQHRPHAPSPPAEDRCTSG